MAAGDVDGDGDFDVLINNRADDLVRLYSNNGDGTFTQSDDYTFTRFGGAQQLDILAVALRDLNDDGNADLIVAGSDTVGVRLSNGDGTFASAETYSRTGVKTLEFADLDGDDSLDIVAMNGTRYSVLLSDGDGTFHNSTSETQYLWSSQDAKLADIDGDGQVDLVYVDGARNSVGVMAGQGDGSFATTANAVLTAVDVAINSLGELFIVDQAGSRIQKYASSGELLANFGEYDSGPGELNYPRSVAIDSNDNVYVADTNNHRIAKYDANGVFLSAWGVRGSGPGEFERPYGIAIDSADAVFVADKDNYRIQKFSTDGTYLSSFGDSGDGTGPGELWEPVDLDVDGAGHVCVLDMNINHPNDAIVQVFDGSGTSLDSWSTLGDDPAPLIHRPLGIAVDSADSVYVSEGFGHSDAHRVQRFDKAGVHQQSFGSYGSLAGQLWEPQGMAIDGAGNLHVAARLGVQVYTASGDPLEMFGVELRVAGGPTGLLLVDLDQDGNHDIITSNGVGVPRDPFGPDSRSDDSGAHTISVLYGLGDGEFTTHYDCQVGREPSSTQGGGLQRRRSPGCHHPQFAGSQCDDLVGLRGGRLRSTHRLPGR